MAQDSVTPDHAAGEADPTLVQAQVSGGASGEKGFFDHVAEYLRPGLAVEPAGSSTGRDESEDAVEPAAQAAAVAEVPPAPLPDAPGAIAEQSFVFTETAEELVVEKEFFVREEVVIRKLVENHVHEVDERVRRTEVEVERLGPQEAAPPEIAPEPPAAPVQERAVQPVPKTAEPSNDFMWWAWRILLFTAAVILAFVAGQMVGSFFPAE